MLEEIGLPYAVRTVNIAKREQFDPAFVAISPGAKIPAIVDEDAAAGGLAIFESAAILTYLADKSGRFLPNSGARRAATLGWLHWQIGGLAPTLAEFGHFTIFAKQKIPSAIDRLAAEADRLLCVLERRLAQAPFIGGDDYSIADVAAYPWTVGATILVREHVETKPHISAWLRTIGERPAVQRGMAVPAVERTRRGPAANPR